jgi:polysaccharide export outer membrane protein
LGEVSRPGVYTNYNDNITILEALGMAGDITIYGNKRNILLLRPAKKGVETIRINLNDAKLLESSNFYMLPNDILYVEPVKTKAFRLNAPNISIILSTITTFILVLNFIK